MDKINILKKYFIGICIVLLCFPIFPFKTFAATEYKCVANQETFLYYSTSYQTINSDCRNYSVSWSSNNAALNAILTSTQSKTGVGTASVNGRYTSHTHNNCAHETKFNVNPDPITGQGGHTEITWKCGYQPLNTGWVSDTQYTATYSSEATFVPTIAMNGATITATCGSRTQSWTLNVEKDPKIETPLKDSYTINYNSSISLPVIARITENYTWQIKPSEASDWRNITADDSQFAILENTLELKATDYTYNNAEIRVICSNTMSDVTDISSTKLIYNKSSFVPALTTNAGLT